MDNRIKTTADAATLLFLQQGYSKTQISHIAKAVGVSVGTIYLDFTGKKEIMHFILKSVIEPEFINREFDRPITDQLFLNIEDEIVDLFELIEIRFTKNLKNKANEYSLEALVSDTFDLFSRYAVGCLFIEKNQFDFAKLAACYKSFRKKFFETMASYLSMFIENGTMRPVEHLELVTTFIIETLTWWAMDRCYTSFEMSDISMELAKKICMDNIISAYKQ